VAAVQDAEARLASAQADYNSVVGGPTQAALDEAQQAIRLATINLAAARASAQPDPDQAQRLAAARNEIAHLQSQIEARQLFAPCDCQIAKIMVQPGAPVQASTPIFIALDASVPASDQLVQVQEVASQDATGASAAVSDTTNPGAAGTPAAQLQIGQKVTVSFDRYSGKMFPGTVSGDTSNGYQVKYDAPNLEVNVGDQARVMVESARRENTLWLPSKVIKSGTPTVVTVQKGNDRHQVTIQTGVAGQERVEILSGLNEGDVVLDQ
jgi:multidrug efflux pump subunit AcrA (membrane-fusion protein)